MARLPQCEPIYQAMQLFMQRCLRNDTSLLWPERSVWTLANVAELKRRFIDNPLIGSDTTFDQKLELQLQGASPDVWAMLGDIYYVYYLPSTHIKQPRRQATIRQIAGKGGLPDPDPGVWKVGPENGFVRTSQMYHGKYSQMWLIILFAYELKAHPELQAALDDPKQMRKVLDSVLDTLPNKKDRAVDMRHALLYMSFPDHYERIISTGDKRDIVGFYKERVPAASGQDLDDALYTIRNTVAVGEDFDHYSLRDEWRRSQGEGDGSDSAASQEPVAGPEKQPVKSAATPATDRRSDPDIVRVRNALKMTRNVVLYGPPGTGKTYVARKVAELLVEGQLGRKLPEVSALLDTIADLTFYDILALSMYVSGARGQAFQVPELRQHAVLQARFQLSPVGHPNEGIWRTLQLHTDPASQTVRVTSRTEPFLFDKVMSGGESRWLLTDEGRRHVETELAASLAAIRAVSSTQVTADHFIRQITFHQSYAYEDFVEGIRPKPSEDGEMTYLPVEGVFRSICTRAELDPANAYILIVDELNRGNIAKVFGELISLIEDDKRGTMTVELPYSHKSFSVPRNLILIGTMNSSDRSIALLDIALRRRFAFLELTPRVDLVEEIVVESTDNQVNLGTLLHRLNKGIRETIGRDYEIGHSYFQRIAQFDQDERATALDFVWNHQLRPLLNDYFYNQPDDLRKVLGAAFFDSESDAEERDNAPGLGGAELHDEALLYALSQLSG